MPVDNTMTPRSKAPSDAAIRLRTLRAEQGLSQSELAGLAGLSRKTVQRIEGGASLSGDAAARLQWALDLPEGELAPEWDLPENPHDPGYGCKARARRRALGLTLGHVASLTGVSVATLSRFECGLS
ncbi:MAG: XRE family transcriptional regulator, partial [Oxalobacteraceae bacterium]